jgi:hypothetical protein
MHTRIVKIGNSQGDTHTKIGMKFASRITRILSYFKTKKTA